MCGILGAISTGPLKNHGAEVVKMLRESEERGRDAFGFYAFNLSDKPVYQQDEVILAAQLYKKQGKVTDFFSNRGKIHFDSVEAFLGHTRQATTGSEKEMKNNHPFESKDFVWGHNGIISNYTGIKHKLELEYDSDCDSYVIGAAAQHYLDGGASVEDAIKKAADELMGSFAVWIVYKPTNRIFFFKNAGRPLDYATFDSNGNKVFVFASVGQYLVKSFDAVKGTKEINAQILHELDVSEGTLISHGKYEAERVYSSSGDAYPKADHSGYSRSHMGPGFQRQTGPNKRDNPQYVWNRLHEALNKYRTTKTDLFKQPSLPGITIFTEDAALISAIGTTTFAGVLKPVNDEMTKYMVTVPESEVFTFISELDTYFRSLPEDERVLEFFPGMVGITVTVTDRSTIEIQTNDKVSREILEAIGIRFGQSDRAFIFGKNKKRYKKLQRIKRDLENYFDGNGAVPVTLSDFDD